MANAPVLSYCEPSFAAISSSRKHLTAMEFATTALQTIRGADDSWMPTGARSFFVCGLRFRDFTRQLSRRIGAIVRLLLIAIFGAIGTLARYGLQGAVQTTAGFPYGTLLVNLLGCFFLGLIGQFTMNRMVISPELRVAIAVGFFGGFTTFSSFGWETAKMLEEGAWARASAYVGASVFAGLLLTVAGIRLANRF
jgi:fluoride exporter